MGWTRAEQAAALFVSVAAVAGSIALVLLRRPAPPVQLIGASQATEVIVQVDGAVVRPGLYRLPSGARVQDALRAAGGLSASADDEALNLAKPARDGDRITVPHRLTGSRRDSIRRIPVNTASEAELFSLPGIGPVLARRIVDHRRRHGAFVRLEDLLQVEGIGPKLLERLRPLVTVQ